MKHKEYITLSEKIAVALNAHVLQFCKTRPAFKAIATEYAAKRIHLNAIQCYVGFQAANPAERFDTFFNIPIALECIMLMAYKTNRILDHKQEVWESEGRIKATVLDERMHFSLILELMEDAKGNLKEKYPVVLEILLRLISKLHEGFWLEQHFLKIDTSKPQEVLKHWAATYNKRNILLNSVYDYAPLIGFYLGSHDASVFEKYERYVKDTDRISHSGQIVNDVSDFSSAYDEHVKSYQDAFSDIRNRIITYPTYGLIKERVILDALNQPQLTKDLRWRKQVMNLLVKKKIVEKIKRLTEKSYAENISFWNKIMHVNTELLSYTYLFLVRNKYYEEFSRLQPSKALVVQSNKRSDTSRIII